MATIVEVSSGVSLSTSGGEMAGILHLNPTPLVVGSGEAIVYSKSMNGPQMGITLIELPAPIGGTNGNFIVTITGFSANLEASGGGAWSLVIGGSLLAGNPEAEWTNYNAYYNGSVAALALGPQTLNLLAKDNNPNGRYAIALGDATTSWNYQSLQIKVQAGYDVNDHMLQTPWTVTFGYNSIPVEWTSVIPVSVRRGVNKSGDTMTGVLNMAGNRITTVGSAVNATDVVIKSQLDANQMRRGALVVGVLNAGVTSMYPNIPRLGSMDSVINVVNRSGIPGFSWAVVYDTDYLLTIYIKNMNAVSTDFGTFHFYQAAL